MATFPLVQKWSCWAKPGDAAGVLQRGYLGRDAVSPCFRPRDSFALISQPLTHPPATGDGTCWASRPLQGDWTQSFQSRQELLDPYQRPHSQCNAPPLPRAACSTPSWPLLGNVHGPLLILPLQGTYTPPTNQQVFHKTPRCPTNRQVSRCILTPLLSLGCKNRHDHVCLGRPSLVIRKLSCCACSISYLNKLYFLSMATCSINSSLFSPQQRGVWKFFSDPRAQTPPPHFHLAFCLDMGWAHPAWHILPQVSP